MAENKKRQDKDVLLHACCGICAGYPIQYLREMGYNPVVFFYNPNIHPEEEYKKRLNAQKQLCESLNCELIIEEYESDLYEEIMMGYEKYKEGSERCKRCFELRLLKTVQKAKALGFSNYTTTLAVSPYKNFKMVAQVGENFSKCFGVEFLAIDFKKKDGFLKTNIIANGLNLYRQKYCGCFMSMVEREKSIKEKAEKEQKAKETECM